MHTTLSYPILLSSQIIWLKNGRRNVRWDIDAEAFLNNFQKLYASTIAKIRCFQYRLVHRIIGTNAKLCRWGIKTVIYVTCVNYKRIHYYLHFYEYDKVVPLDECQSLDFYRNWQKYKLLHDWNHHWDTIWHFPNIWPVLDYYKNAYIVASSQILY